MVEGKWCWVEIMLLSIDISDYGAFSLGGLLGVFKYLVYSTLVKEVTSGWSDGCAKCFPIDA